MKINWVSSKPTIGFIPALRRRASERALGIAKAVWLGAVQRTPVHSGELRASWNLSVGTPNYGAVGESSSAPRNPLAPMPPPAMPNVQAVDLASAKYFVTNGKDYAIHVEYGSPSTAPRLMLTRSIQAAKR